MIEKWSRWEPIAGLSGKYYITTISDCINELKISLAHENDPEQKLEIIFEHSLLSYAVTDETLKHMVFCDLTEKYGTDFYATWSFFKIADSLYINRLKESYSELNPTTVIHFCIFDQDFIVDIITTQNPKISLL